MLLIPGFLCGDGSLRHLAAFLEASGHCPQPSGSARNIGCSERAVRDLTERVDALAERFGQRVALVGHSRGGLFARVLAHRRPDIVSGIVMLGSPWRDQLAVHPLLWAQAFALATLGNLGVRMLRATPVGRAAAANDSDVSSRPRWRRASVSCRSTPSTTASWTGARA